MRPLLAWWWTGAVPVLIGALAPLTVAGPSYAVAIFAMLAVTFFLAPAVYDREGRTVWAGSMRAWTSPAAIALIVFFAIAAIGTAISIDPMKSAICWLRNVFYLGLGAVFWRYLTDRPEARERAYRTLLFGAVPAATIALVALFLWPGLIGLLTWQGADIPLSTAKQALKSHTIAISCVAPAISWLAWRAGGPGWRAFALVYPLLVFFIGIGANKQAAVFTLLSGYLGMVFAVVLARLRWQAALALIAASGLAVLAVLAYLWTHLPAYPQPHYADFQLPAALLDHHRQVIWAFTLAQIMEHLWFGVGMNVSNLLPGADQIIPQFNQEYLPSHPHNFVLEVWLETGIFGLAALLTAIAALLWGIYKRLRGGYTGAVAAAGLYAAFWNANLYNFSFWSSWWLIFFIVVMAMLFAAPRK